MEGLFLFSPVFIWKFQDYYIFLQQNLCYFFLPWCKGPHFIADKASFTGVVWLGGVSGHLRTIPTEPILNSRKSYYEQLEQAQKGSIDITGWVAWFLVTLHQAITTSIGKMNRVMRKTDFWDRHADTDVNERQRKVINRLWDGFEGKLNSSKWAKMCHCSQDTALRDIHDLIGKGILRDTGEGGRSKNYELIGLED